MLTQYLISTNYQKILSFFLLHWDVSFYERELARKTGLKPSSTHYVLTHLYQAGIISRKRAGQMYFYNVDKTNPFLKSYKILVNLLLIEPLIEKLKRLSYKIVLFGSWANGSDNENSDIDLFIVSSEKEKVLSLINKFCYSSKLANRKIQPIVNSPEELLRKTSRERVFLEEVEKGKILWEREVNNDAL